MKLHPIQVESYTSLEDLGRQLAGMRYDMLEDLLSGMIVEFRRQKESDEAAGRVKLAYRLNELVYGLENAQTALDEVVHICKPHIEAEIAERTRQREEIASKPWRPQVLVRS